MSEVTLQRGLAFDGWEARVKEISHTAAWFSLQPR